MVLEDLHFFPESTLILIISFSEDKILLVLFVCDISFQVRFYDEAERKNRPKHLAVQKNIGTFASKIMITMSLEEYKNKVRESAEKMWHLDEEDRAYMENQLALYTERDSGTLGTAREEAYWMFL